jgi:MFS family permease
MGVHQLVLLVCIPLLTGLIKFYDFYTLLTIGSFFTAVSPAVLFYSNNYWTLGVFVVVMSVGEAIYAPRLVDYTIAAAPKGKEAIYLGLSNMPNSLGLLMTGISSGFLLAEFCPQNGEKQCFWVWILIGLYCFIAFLIVLIFRPFFEDKHDESHIAESELSYAETKKTLLIE